MFRTDTTGTLTLINRVGRAGVSAVPEEIISTSRPYRAEWSGFNRSVNGSSATQAAGHRAMLPSVSSGLEVQPAATMSTWGGDLSQNRGNSPGTGRALDLGIEVASLLRQEAIDD